MRNKKILLSKTRFKENNLGFTLLELVLVIVVIGILAISTLPRFMNLKQQSREEQKRAIMGAVRSGISLYRTNTSIDDASTAHYPLALDSEGKGPCRDCFSNVLNIPFGGSYWSKVDDKTYKYEDGKKLETYVYNSNEGTFK